MTTLRRIPDNSTRKEEAAALAAGVRFFGQSIQLILKIDLYFYYMKIASLIKLTTENERKLMELAKLDVNQDILVTNESFIESFSPVRGC